MGIFWCGIWEKDVRHEESTMKGWIQKIAE